MDFKKIVDRAPHSISSAFKKRHYKKGTTILFPNEENDTLFLLVSGAIDIFKQAYNGTSIAIRSYKAYTYFGEMELFNKDYRTVNVVAKTDCVTYELSKDKVIEWIHQDPELAIHFIEELTVRLANTSEIRLKLSLLTIRERLLYSLLTHQQIGDLKDLTKKQLCDEVSAPIRSLNRSIAECVEEGIIDYKHKIFSIKDLESLEKIALTLL